MNPACKGQAMEAYMPQPSDASAIQPQSVAPLIHAESAPDENWVALEANKLPLRLPLALEEILAGVIMVLLGLITLANVLARYVFHVSFAFTEEYSSVLLFCLVFVTAASAIAENKHIKMTFFTEKLSHRHQKWAELLGCAAVAVCLGVTAWYGGVMTWDAWQTSETSSGIGHPMWMYLIWFPILCLLGVVRALGCMARIQAVKLD